MSSDAFAAFSKAGSEVGGEEATVALRVYLLEKNSGARIAPHRIAKALGLDQDIVDDLISIAVSTEVGLLEDASQVRCSSCESRIDLRILRQKDDDDAECPDCGGPMDDFEHLLAERRYRLTESAATEAEQWQEERAARPQMRVVILTALVEELSAIREQLGANGITPTQRVVANGGIYYEAAFQGEFVDWKIYSSFTQAASVDAAAGTIEAILNFDPHIAMFVGIAGGIAEKEVGLGDVIAATEVFDYDHGKDTSNGLTPRAQQLKSAFSLNQLAGILVIERSWSERIITVVADLGICEPEVHVEPIAAGGKVVASTKSETYKLIRRTADRAVAVEMEGSGFLGAVGRYSGVDGIVIRGVSDLIDSKDESDKAGVRKQAVANAAAFAFEMLYCFQRSEAK